MKKKKTNIPSGREQGFLARKSTLYTYVRAIRTKEQEEKKQNNGLKTRREILSGMNVFSKAYNSH